MYQRTTDLQKRKWAQLRAETNQYFLIFVKSLIQCLNGCGNVYSLPYFFKSLELARGFDSS